MIKTIAIQGQAASFHDIATRNFFGSEIELVCCDTFAETFQVLTKDLAGYAVVAIENSLYGSINEVYDLLLKYRFWISGEVYLRIEQCLIGLPGATISGATEVHSHPVALAQCENYLNSTLNQAERFEHHDTAGSVADIKKWGDPAKTAIASAAAAHRHDMDILARKIETHKQNYTRFVVLSKDRVDNPAANKTSLILATAEKPGALYHALGTFAKQNINLTKLQSRPIIGNAWHYMFYVDVDSGLEQPGLQAALYELNDQNCETTILGSYRSGH